jgi:hypothetical protein
MGWALEKGHYVVDDNRLEETFVALSCNLKEPEKVLRMFTHYQGEEKDYP